MAIINKLKLEKGSYLDLCAGWGRIFWLVYKLDQKFDHYYAHDLCFKNNNFMDHAQKQHLLRPDDQQDERCIKNFKYKTTY